MSEGPKFWYVVGSIADDEHVVFVVHETTPDIFRRVAAFTNKVRAEDYAEMENDFRPGRGTVDELLQGRDGDDQPAAAHVAEPRSALSVRRTTVVETTRTRIAHQEEVGEDTPESGASGSHVWALPRVTAVPDRPVEQVAVAPSASAGAITTADAPKSAVPGGIIHSTSLTESEAKVFEALVGFAARMHKPSIAQIAITSGVPNGSITHLLLALERKGYIKNDGVRFAPDYRVIVQGKPIVETPMVAEPPLPSPATAKIEPQDDPVEAPLSAADLSDRQRSALICVSRDDLSDRTLALASIGTHELPKILLRLRDFELIGLGVGGKWHLLPDGERIANEIKTKKGPGPVEAKISMPVVRQPAPEKHKDVSLKHDQAAKDAVARFTETGGVRKFHEADSAAHFNIADYLTRKGHHVSGASAWKSAWMIDGKRMDWDAVVSLVNKHRVQAELPPLTF